MLNPFCVDPVIFSLLTFDSIHLSELFGNESNTGILGYELRYNNHTKDSLSVSMSAFFIFNRSLLDDVVKGMCSFWLSYA